MRIEQQIHELQIGWHKRFRLVVGYDHGFGDRDKIGGFDTIEEAHDVARKIEAYANQQICEGWRLMGDPEMNLYYWIWERTGPLDSPYAVVFEGRDPD